MAAIAEIGTGNIDNPTIRPHALAMAITRDRLVVLDRIHASDGIVGGGNDAASGRCRYNECAPKGIEHAIQFCAARELGSCDPVRVGLPNPQKGSAHTFFYFQARCANSAGDAGFPQHLRPATA